MKKLELLDTILIELSKKPEMVFSGAMIYSTINSNYEGLIEELKRGFLKNYLDKLVIGGYLKTSIIEQNVLIYQITWEGDFFISQGGFRVQKEKEEEEKDRLKKLEINQNDTNVKMIKIQSSLGRMTCWIMIATIIAGVYYLLEILNHFFYLYPCIK